MDSFYDLNAKISRCNDLVDSQIDGETVMLDIESGKYFGLDQIATEIWSLLETPTSIACICKQLERDYKVSSEHCERDVLSFIREMKSKGLLIIEEQVASKL